MNTTAIVDRISTAELMDRYRLNSRTAIANRIKALGITEERDSGKLYVPVEALERLDALHECLKKPGATLEECATVVNSGASSLQAVAPRAGDPRIGEQAEAEESSALESDRCRGGLPDSSRVLRAAPQAVIVTPNSPLDTSVTIWSAIASSVQDKFSIQLLPQPDPLANYRLLEEVAKKGWALPTSQLLPMLGLKSVPRLECDGSTFFSRRGFRFERQPKTGLESEWRVSKTASGKK